MVKVPSENRLGTRECLVVSVQRLRSPQLLVYIKSRGRAGDAGERPQSRVIDVCLSCRNADIVEGLVSGEGASPGILFRGVE